VLREFEETHSTNVEALGARIKGYPGDMIEKTLLKNQKKKKRKTHI